MSWRYGDRAPPIGSGLIDINLEREYFVPIYTERIDKLLDGNLRFH